MISEEAREEFTRSVVDEICYSCVGCYTIALYIVDADQKLSKRFTITNSLMWFLTRKTQSLLYGTSDPNGKQTKVILQWEKEKRVPLEPNMPDGMQRSTS